MERIVTYTVPASTAGEDAESSPSFLVQKTCPVCLLIALSVALSASWKMRSP